MFLVLLLFIRGFWVAFIILGSDSVQHPHSSISLLQLTGLTINILTLAGLTVADRDDHRQSAVVGPVVYRKGGSARGQGCAYSPPARAHPQWPLPVMGRYPHHHGYVHSPSFLPWRRTVPCSCLWVPPCSSTLLASVLRIAHLDSPMFPDLWFRPASKSG